MLNEIKYPVNIQPLKRAVAKLRFDLEDAKTRLNKAETDLVKTKADIKKINDKDNPTKS